jgi:hypothetical protein
VRLAAIVTAIVLATAWFAGRSASALADPWLFVTDIHLEAQAEKPEKPAFLSPFGQDTSPALFESAVRAMQRIDPHPPVVVVTGDLLAHDITQRTALPTVVRIARRLNRAFPQAQFVLALGNEDAPCADYSLAPDASFLRDVGVAWEPLVNRRGAAPDFRRTFGHDGFYTAKLPIPGLRAIVVDDVFWSPRYRAKCGRAGNVVTNSLTELETALKQNQQPAWVLFHIPPGVDTFSSAQLARRLAIVPFLNPYLRDRFVAALGNPANHVVLAVAGHTHKFAYRIVNAGTSEPVPMLLVPSVSPIFRNAPSFLTANVDARGVLRDVNEVSLQHGAWTNIGGMPSLGVEAFTGSQLVELQDRLANDPKLRATFERLYEGGAPPEINDRNWPIYWCAATAFATAPFRACTQSGGVGPITRRGIKVLLIPAVVVALLAGALVFWRRRRRRVLRS